MFFNKVFNAKINDVSEKGILIILLQKKITCFAVVQEECWVFKKKQPPQLAPPHSSF